VNLEPEKVVSHQHLPQLNFDKKVHEREEVKVRAENEELIAIDREKDDNAVKKRNAKNETKAQEKTTKTMRYQRFTFFY